MLIERMVYRWAGWSVAVLLLVAARLAFAQEPHPEKHQGKTASVQGKAHGQAQRKNPLPGGGPPTPSVFQRLRELPPQEQERAMASEQFRRLPPERQQKIRQNLESWNAMAPEQKDTFRQREEIFQSLSPGQRDELRSVFPRWHALPPGRQQQLMQGFRQLRDMPPEERQGYLSSPQTVKQFTPDERDILGSLNRLLPGSEGAAPATETEPDL